MRRFSSRLGLWHTWSVGTVWQSEGTMEIRHGQHPVRVLGRGTPCEGCAAVGGGLCGLLQGVPSRPVSDLRHHERLLDAGEDLLRPGDPVDETITCLSGWLFSYYLLEDGRRQILAFILPGEIILTAGERRAAPFGLQALTRVRACGAPNAWLRRWLSGRPEEARRLMMFSTRHETLSYGLLTSLGRRNAKERVAYLLTELALRLRRQGLARTSTELPLTQGVIADTLGLTAVHVNRTLAHLRTVGAVGYVNRRLHVLDLDRLRHEAGAVHDPLLAWLGDGASAASGQQRRLM